MKPFPVAELERLALDVQDAMQDTCTIDVYTETAGDLNEPIVTYPPGDEVKCRFRGKISHWLPTPDYALSSVDALLQLPPDAVITNRDHVTIVARFGQRLESPPIYEVKGEPTPAIYSQHVMLVEHHL